VLRILLPIMTYLIGYFISYYSIQEIKGKQKIFQYLINSLKIILIIFVIIELIIAKEFIQLILLPIILLIALLLIRKLKKKELINSMLLGVILGTLYNNDFIVIIICSIIFFRANKDYLNKRLIVNSLKKILALTLIGIFSALISNNYLLIISSALLIRMMI